MVLMAYFGCADYCFSGSHNNSFCRLENGIMVRVSSCCFHDLEWMVVN